MQGVVFSAATSKLTNLESAFALDALVLRRRLAAAPPAQGATVPTSYAEPVPHPNDGDPRVLYPVDAVSGPVAREQGFALVAIEQPGPFYPPSAAADEPG